MPLKPGKSKKVVEENFDEFRHGPTFQKTMRKYGKKVAVKQMQAAVLSKKRESSKKKTAKKRVATKS